MTKVIVKINGTQTPFQKNDYYSACKMVGLHLGLSSGKLEILLKQGNLKVNNDFIQVDTVDEEMDFSEPNYTHRAVINGKEHLFALTYSLADNKPSWIGKNKTMRDIWENEDFQYYPLEKIDK